MRKDGGDDAERESEVQAVRFVYFTGRERVRRTKNRTSAMQNRYLPKCCFFLPHTRVIGNENSSFDFFLLNSSRNLIQFVGEILKDKE